MKHHILIVLSIATIIVLGLSSCNDWLEVSPKSQIILNDHFESEGGFKDQLTGVYTAMTSSSMYGLHMGIGFTEVLSQNYDVNSDGMWRYASTYDYTNTASKSIIDGIWSKTYNSITNLNLVIENIDKVDKNIFSNNNYYIYKGEALGLRAFFHLEMMRLFAESPASNKNANGVPYYTKYSSDVVEQKTVEETMNLIIDDLKEARGYLEHDSLKIATDQYLQRSSRTCYFNYYATVATLARAYLWKGDLDNALVYAQEIIDELNSDKLNKPFNWVHVTSIETSQPGETDRAFTTEHLFNLKINNWEDIGNYYFKEAGGTSSLSPSELKAQNIYEQNQGLGLDYRFSKAFEVDGSNRYVSKFWYIEGGRYNNLYPIIRMTESFYIAAEVYLKKGDKVKAIELLNEVRSNRHLSDNPLSYDLTEVNVQREIWKEYRKEFLAEGGQLFYYYKRLNASEIIGAGVTPGKNTYVLPIPSTDIEFGGYSN